MEMDQKRINGMVIKVGCTSFPPWFSGLRSSITPTKYYGNWSRHFFDIYARGLGFTRSPPGIRAVREREVLAWTSGESHHAKGGAPEKVRNG